MIRKLLKKLGLTACRHKWEIVNKQEVLIGHTPIQKCKKCGEYLR